MSDDTKPTIVLVHGAWHSVECWTKVIPLLEAQGYECVAVGLPTVDNAPVATSWDDADKIREVVEALINQGKKVVPVLHSAGGHVGCSGVAGLGLEERKANGQQGGVTRIVCIAAVLFPEESVGSKNDRFVNYIGFWTLSPTEDSSIPNDPVRVFYNDLSEEDAKYWASKLRWTSSPSKQPKRAGWRTIPMSYLACEHDNAIPLATQLALVEDMKEYGAKQIDVTTISTSHSPFLSRPESVVDFVINAAKS